MIGRWLTLESKLPFLSLQSHVFVLVIDANRAGWNRLQEVFGGNAVSDEYGIGRHVANLFVTQTYEGQSDIHSTGNEPPERYGNNTELTGRKNRFNPRQSNHWDPGVLLGIE